MTGLDTPATGSMKIQECSPSRCLRSIRKARVRKLRTVDSEFVGNLMWEFDYNFTNYNFRKTLVVLKQILPDW